MPKRFSESSAKSGLIYCGTRKVKQPPGFMVRLAPGSKEMPAAIRVLCMDMALIHGLACEHPEVLEYSAEARLGWAN